MFWTYLILLFGGAFVVVAANINIYLSDQNYIAIEKRHVDDPDGHAQKNIALYEYEQRFVVLRTVAVLSVATSFLLAFRGLAIYLEVPPPDLTAPAPG
jgi:hypothetical protein